MPSGLAASCRDPDWEIHQARTSSSFPSVHCVHTRGIQLLPGTHQSRSCGSQNQCQSPHWWFPNGPGKRPECPGLSDSWFGPVLLLSPAENQTRQQCTESPDQHGQKETGKALGWTQLHFRTFYLENQVPILCVPTRCTQNPLQTNGESHLYSPS